jgi:hypothetical protein
VAEKNAAMYATAKRVRAFIAVFNVEHEQAFLKEKFLQPNDNHRPLWTKSGETQNSFFDA